MSEIADKATTYIESSPYAFLITVDEENKPLGRFIGPVVNIGMNVYFVTRINSQKVNQINNNPFVTLHFQSPDQSKNDFRSVTLNGKVAHVTEEKEFDEALEKLGQISPAYKNYICNDGFKTWTIYKVTGNSLQYTDTDFKNSIRTVKEEF